ncbi:phosphotriesterase family protein [Parapedobacter sp. DT-150]|uniref:phosphotriesterase family protein n=1 Tax=Parapedobacter sp. DT-150 TaxID=3396162 RepID=UPI003F1A09DA
MKTQRFVRTVLGDIAPENMGLTYSHEHIVIDESFPTVQNPLFLLRDVDRISTELKTFYNAGGRTMVDTMPADCGRNVAKLAAISRNTGVHIIAATGIHLEMYYLPNHWRYSYTEEQLTQLFIDDVMLGIDVHDYNGPFVERTPHKAGMIKLATGDENITAHQEKIVHAVVNTHRETGVPILTHTNAGKHAIDQAVMFEKLGADLTHVVISHVDRYQDIGYNRAVLETGVRVEYDSAFRWKEKPNWTYKLLEVLLADFPDQITMGMDAAKTTYWRSYGGAPGLDFLLTVFKRDLEAMGLGRYYEQLFVRNPAQLYTFVN